MEFEKAKVERFLLVESFAGLVERLTTSENERYYSLEGSELCEWKVFKAELITLVRSRNIMTQVDVIHRLTPLVEKILPLLRYFDEEELTILAEENFLDERLLKFNKLIINTKQMLVSEVKNLAKCEKFLNKAISIMLKLKKERKDDSCLLCPQLAEAYCIRALCRQDADPNSNSKRIMQDVDCTLKSWSAMPTLPKKHLNMLYHIYDFLSVKGNTKHHSMIYQIMLKSLNSKSDDDLKDWCLKLWRSRRVSHTFCGSPVCEVFLTTISKYCEWSDNAETWKRGMDILDAVGFQHKLALSSHVPYHQDLSVHSSINEVKQVATDVIQKDPLSSHSQFVVGHLYYELVETLISKGLMIEALFYAREAYKLRRELLDTMFYMKPQENIVDGNREAGSKYDYQTCNIDRQVGTTPWSYDEVLSDSTNLILTPWNILKCFLESTLQCGNLEDNVMLAEDLLLNGKNNSRLQGLSVFSIQFSRALGRFYFKQQKWQLAEAEIKNAQKLWDDVNKSHISCLKCNAVLEISIKQLSGDLYLETKTIKEIGEVISCYMNCEEQLKCSMWENKFTSPEEVVSTRRMFCGECSGLVAEDDGKSCWQCQASRITRSMSLQNVGYMKVEYIRRSILIRLLERIGKCHRLQRDRSSEKKVLLQRLSLFVVRSAYNNSVSNDLISKIIHKRLTGFAYTIDYATTIYEACCFCLRNTSQKPKTSMEKLLCGLKIAYMLSRQVPTLHQQVSRLLGILYTQGKVPTKQSVAPSVEQWASYFHQSSIGGYFNNSMIARMGNQEGQNPMEDKSPQNSEGFLEECVLHFFKKLPDFPIICFSMYGEDLLLPSNLLPHSPTLVWMQLSRLGSDEVPIIVDIVPVESSFEDTVYSDLRIPFISSERRILTVVDKVASVFRSVHEVKEILVKDQIRPKSERMDFKKWFKKLKKLDDFLSVILSDLETKWFSRLKEFFLGDRVEEPPEEVLEGKTLASLQLPVILVMDPEMQMVPWESMPFLRLQDTYRMPSVMSILSTLQRNCSYEETGVYPIVDPRQVYYVLNPQNNLQDNENILLPVFKANKFMGLAGRFPSSSFLKEVFKVYDIFLFNGHGSGLSRMTNNISEELDSSASMVLMACNSGAIKLNGSYSPSGLILDYVLSGSPVITSHLWPIRSDDSVMMIQSMVKYWKQKKCRRTMASSVAIARDSCKLPYIEGAGFVCYGVPTLIRRKVQPPTLEDG